MKVRVILEDDFYFPQWQGWLFGWWHYYWMPSTPQPDGLECGPEQVRFCTQPEAEKFLQAKPEPRVMWEGEV